MIHHKATQPQPWGQSEPDHGMHRHYAVFASVEACASAVRKAKRAADESLQRAQEAPEPHATTNTIFIALYEAHLRDRETLFSAMRRLDEAQAALRTLARATPLMADGEPGPTR